MFNDFTIFSIDSHKKTKAIEKPRVVLLFYFYFSFANWAEINQ